MNLKSISSQIQTNGLVRIKTDMVERASDRTREARLRGMFEKFQLGFIIETMPSTSSSEVLVLRRNRPYAIVHIGHDYLEVLCDDFSNSEKVLSFLRKNNTIDIKNCSLGESEQIYPIIQRPSHERLNDLDIEEIQQIYPYEELVTHLIKALMCIHSLEERFKKIAENINYGPTSINNNLDYIEDSAKRMGRITKSTVELQDKRKGDPGEPSTEQYIYSSERAFFSPSESPADPFITTEKFRTDIS